MTNVELIEEIKKLEPLAQLDLAESTLRILRTDIRIEKEFNTTERQSKQLREAAAALLTEYHSNPELTAFSVLDSEEFHE